MPTLVYEQQRLALWTWIPSFEASGAKFTPCSKATWTLMLQLKRDGATVEDYPPAGEIVTTDRINRVAGVLMSYVAGACTASTSRRGSTPAL